MTTARMSSRSDRASAPVSGVGGSADGSNPATRCGTTVRPALTDAATVAIAIGEARTVP